MPTYEYRCIDCGRQFDMFQNMTDEPLTECTECGGTLKRLIGAGAGLIFKGSGFYCTDYRSDGYRSAAKQETKPAASSSSSLDGGGTEAKAAPDTPKSGTAGKGSDT